MNDTNKDHLEMIDDCAARESRLSEWEGNFISSITETLYYRISLTSKQIETLENIWEKVTKQG